MREAIEFIASVDLAKLAADPTVLVVTAAVAVIAIIMRWKFVMLLIFGIGAILAVARYSDLGEAALDTRMYLFVAGTIAVGFVLIYFLFIKGD